jgi:hypothetical protein
VFGSAPMFFYLLHLYTLKVLYLIGVALFGLNQGSYFGFSSVAAIWLAAASSVDCAVPGRALVLCVEGSAP